MVLKKSNTPFNSGATQKCFNRKAYRPVNEKPSGNWLTISLKNIPVKFDEDNPSSEHIKALEKIYEYLDFDGPNLKTFYESYFDYWSNQSRSLSFSLNKQELWLMPERVEKLMREKNFLDGESGFAEIRVQKVQNIADRRTFHKKETCTLNPQSKSTKRRKRTNHKREQKTKEKKRGVQRAHLFKPKRQDSNDEDDYWMENYRRKIVEVKLQVQDQIDARILGCRSTCYDAFGWVDDTASPKIYPRSNEIKREIQMAISETIDPDQIWEDALCCEDNDDETVEDCEIHNFQQVELGDYLFFSSESYPPKKRRKRALYSKDGKANDEVYLANVNTASSQTTLRHPKGSFQVIQRPCDIIANSTKEPSSITKGSDLRTDAKTETENSETAKPVSSNDDKAVDENEMEESKLDGHNDQTKTQYNHEKTRLLDSFNNSDVFESLVPLHLRFPKVIEEAITNDLVPCTNKDFSINDCPLLFGNCFPLIFEVNLMLKDFIQNEVWSLVGSSSSDITHDNNLTWEFALKNTKSTYPHDNVKETFSFNLGLVKNSILDLEDVVKLALNSIESTPYIRGKDKMVFPKTAAHNQYSKDLFTPNTNDVLSPEVCSMEEAVTKLVTVQNEKIEKLAPSIPATKSQIKTFSEAAECEICFNICDTYGRKDGGIITLLPCNHSFCAECWRSHIFYHLMSGDTQINCMHTDCKESLNETMLKALVPENYLTKLYSQRQEKCIDTSPLCQWCPGTKCNQVAIIPRSSPHVRQFGCCVVCDCGSRWCFSCQSQPHWPASCSQAAAYRTLRQKLGYEIPLDVTCDVDLKPCPGCKYPIEKNFGCPHMTCRMCHFDFCWNCLRSTDDHRVWECTEDENSNFEIYHLHNDVVNNFPLKFFRNVLDMGKKLKHIKKSSVSGWLMGLNNFHCTKIRPSFHQSVECKDAEKMKDRAVLIATNSVQFIINVYSFLEYFYLLYSFALLTNDKDKSETFHSSTQSTADKLITAALRLEDCVVGKTIRQLLVVEERCHLILTTGHELLEKLKSRVISIQKLSQDVPAEPIAQLDPKDYYRLK